MTNEMLRSLLRTYVPGRRVLFKPDTACVQGKVSEGVSGGLLLKVVPLPPWPTAPRPGDEDDPPSERTPNTPQPERYGVEVEMETGEGVETVIVGLLDVDLEPLDLERMRRDLWHRTVHFPWKSGIGVAFEPGMSDHGLIVDVALRTLDEESRDSEWERTRETGIRRIVLSLRFEVDPGVHPQGLNVAYREADFTQCQLMIRRPSK